MDLYDVLGVRRNATSAEIRRAYQKRARQLHPHLNPGDPVAPGEAIGHVEGFKAASDVLCVLRGSFAGMNPALQVDACIVKSDPYETGWLYAARGEPEEDSMDVHGYVKLLEETIRKMQEAGYGDQ